MEQISSAVDQAAAIVERRKNRSTEAISQCDEEMRVIIQERKLRLSNERRQYQVIASLKKDGLVAWNRLKEENKWTKENVLAVFCSGKIPAEMRERKWSRNAPEPLRDDRDILLARLAQKNFYYNYWYSGIECIGRNHIPRFRIPEQFLGDKIVVEMVVRRYPEVLMQDVLPQELLDDDDVFCAYLNSDRMGNIVFDEIENLLSKFSVRIRGNAKLMLEAAKHSRGRAVFDFFSERLAESTTFATQLVKTAEKVPDDALARFSDRAQANPRVARAFVRKNGLCLKHVAKSLRGNNEIVRLACKNRAIALIYCAPGRTKRRLGQDKEFMMDIFSRIERLQYGRHGGLSKLYKMLSPELKRDPECVAAANQGQSFLISDLPDDVAYDREFWMDMVMIDSTFWRKLPVKFEGDVAFARNIAQYGGEEMVTDVLERFPFLSRDRGVWATIVDSPFDEFDRLSDVIAAHAPEHIRLDKELMLQACRNDCDVLRVLSTQFQEDRDFVEAAIQSSSPFALCSISDAAQCLYPELVVKAISNGDGDLRESAVAEDLWSNLDVAKAWVQASGHCPSLFPESGKEDQEFCLLVAKHCDEDDFLHATSEALRHDKAFMKQAIGVNCWIFLCTVDGPLRQDFDLAVVAFSGSSSLKNYDKHDDLVFLWDVYEKAKEKLKAHDGFTKGFLCGMSDHAGSECCLPMLLNGEETSLAFKKRIAEYLGVPTGKELHMLRQVTKNLGDLPRPFSVSVPS